MKIFKHGLPAIMMIVVFMLGFATTADAAFAGKKKQAQTETVVVAESPAQTPPVAPISAPAAGGATTVLLAILSFLLPPLAVFLVYDEIGTPFWVNLILFLAFAVLGFAFLSGLWLLSWGPSVIHALYHVLK